MILQKPYCPGRCHYFPNKTVLRRYASYSHAGGFTLIELVVFIVVMGLLAAGILLTFSRTLQGAVRPEQVYQGMQLASGRMELIMGQRKAQGFAAFIDPCAGASPPAICTLPGGYAIAQPTVVIDANPNFKTITVRLSGPDGIVLQLQSQVGND